MRKINVVVEKEKIIQRALRKKNTENLTEIYICRFVRGAAEKNKLFTQRSLTRFVLLLLFYGICIFRDPFFAAPRILSVPREPPKCDTILCAFFIFRSPHVNG